MNATQTTIVKRADQLAVGDMIDGTSKYDSRNETTHVVHTVQDVQTKTHPVLGKVIQINVAVISEAGFGYMDEYTEFVLRPADRIHVKA